MITLKTVEKEEALGFYEKEGLSATENSQCLCAKDKDEVLGYCLFDLESDKMIIRAIEPQNDLMLLDGVLRSTLHIAANRSIENAVWADKAPEKAFKTLRFINDDNTLNINKLFEEKCCGCNNGK